MYLLYAAASSLIGLGLMGAIYACKRYSRPGSLLRAQLVDMLLIAALVGTVPVAFGSLLVAAVTPGTQIAELGLPASVAGLAFAVLGLWATWSLLGKTVRIVFAELQPSATITPLPPRPQSPGPQSQPVLQAA